MSVLQYPKRINSKDVQVWDNAAFDNGENSENSTSLKFSWSNNIKPISSINHSFESDCSTKENLSPSLIVSPGFDKSPASIKPLEVNNIVSNLIPKSVLKTGVSEKKVYEGVNQDCVERENCVLEERNFDSEIEEIEKEINRLSMRLDNLRLEKAKRNAKIMEKKGRIMGAKFNDPPKKGVRISDEERKVKNSMNVSGKLKTPRRGVSLGPAEIMRGMRRGISVGPMEIYSSTKLKNLGSRQDITPLQPSVDRRKSCYWKLQDVDELRVTKQRGKSMSVSPKSRSKTVNKPQIPKQALTTIGSRKTVKKEGVISLIQPKKLFVNDGGKSVPSSKKPLKSGRVVPSRYSQISSGGSSALKELRKRSWPENEEEIKRSEKKRVSLATESRVKKEWDVPKDVDHKTPLSVTNVLEVVPRIKTYRCTIESPRDSGPAKRVSELVGKKSFFSINDGGEDPDDEFVCQALSFEEEQATKEYPKIRVLHSINESPRDSGAAKRVSQLVGRKPFFTADEDSEMPIFSFEEDVEEN